MPNVAIIETPEEFALAGNGIKYLVSGNPVDTAGANPYLLFQLDVDNWNNIVENNYFVISAKQIIAFPTESNHIIFVFKDVPDNSGYQIPTPISAANRNEYAEQIIAALSKNYYINKYFSFYYDVFDPHEWYLTFRDKKLIELTAPSSINDDGLYIIPTDGSDYTELSNYQLGCMLFYQNNLISETFKYPFPALSVEFDIADFLKVLSVSDFQFPAADKINPKPDALVMYRAKFFEKYGFPINEKEIIADQVRYCLPGGIDRDMLHNFQANGISWYDDHISPHRKFLTWAKDNRQWKTSDIIRLYYFRNVGGNLYLRYRIQKDGGWLEWQNVAFPTPGTAAETTRIIEIILDPEHFFSSEEITDAENFQIVIYHESVGIMSETRNFIINNELSDQRLQFVFANSYEIAYDTIFAYGKSEHDIDIENYNLLSIDKNKNQSRSERTELLTIRSGFISFEDLFFWQELIQSSQRYLIRAGRRIPVRITSTNIFMYKNQNYNFGIEIKIEIDNPDKYRTSIPDDSILFSDYFNQYGYNFNFISGIGSRHTIIDKNGNILPDKPNLKFSGDGVNVDDDTNMTEVSITDSLYFQIDSNYFSSSMLEGNTISTNIDLSSSISAGDIIIISGIQGVGEVPFSTKRTVVSISSISIIFSGTAINPDITTIQKIQHKAQASSIINSHNHTLQSASWSDQEQTIEVPDLKFHSLVFLAPANDSGANLDHYLNAGLMAIEQTPGNLKIKARNHTPTNNINIKIIYIS